MKHLSLLTTQVMVTQSEGWLGATALRAEIEADPLGLGVIGKLADAHNRLTSLQSLRTGVILSLARMDEIITRFDGDFDRLARAIHHTFQALVHASTEEAFADRIRALQERILPIGLRITKKSYLDEAGAALELEKQLVPAVQGELDSLRVGNTSLGALCTAWVATGKSFGAALQERARIEASVKQGGTAEAEVDERAARKYWITATRMLLQALDLLPVRVETREKIVSPLEEAIAAALALRASRRDRAQVTPGAGGDDSEPSEPAGPAEPGSSEAENPPATTGEPASSPLPPAPAA